MKPVIFGGNMTKQVVGKGNVNRAVNVIGMSFVWMTADGIGAEGPAKNEDLQMDLAMITRDGKDVKTTLDIMLAASITVAPRAREGPMEFAEIRVDFIMLLLI